MDEAFPDIAALADDCRFRDCRHGEEPGCAVRNAVVGGMLAADRLAAYQNLTAEMAALETKKEAGRRQRGEGRRPSLRRSRRRSTVDHDEQQADQRRYGEAEDD